MKKVLSVLAVVILIASVLIGCSSLGKVTVEVKKDGEITLTKELNISKESETLEELLIANEKELGVTMEDSDYGKFITGMNNYIADSANNEYYSIYVNGEMAQTGVSEIKLNDKDVYTFELFVYTGEY